MKPGYQPCDSCCDCPVPTLRVKSKSASKTKCGFDEFVTPSSPPKKYLTKTPSCSLSYVYEQSFCESEGTCGPGTVHFRIEDVAELTGDAAVSYDPATCVPSGTWGSQSRERYSQVADWFVDCTLVVGDWGSWVASEYGSPIEAELGAYLNGYDSSSCCSSVQTPTTLTQTGIPCRETSCPNRATETWTGSFSITLSDEYTTDALITALLDDLSGGTYGAWADGSAGDELTFFTIAADELSASVFQSKYSWRHKVSKVGSGCYRVLWDQVYVPKCGLEVDSLESKYPIGGYTPGDTPAVIISEPNIGSCGASIPATATALANAEGILEFTITQAGTHYGADAVAFVDGHPLMVHLATADQKIYTWDKATPAGYDPSDPATWPESTEYEASLPPGLTVDSVGSVVIMNYRSVCNGCV